LTEKIHRTVVRNQSHKAGSFNVRERHNERKNECYGNGDIVPERSALNIHFRRLINPDGTPETYEAAFSRMLSSGEISTRGLPADPNVFDEFIFDINSTYFENHGGYEYAKSFFEEAYRLAVQEVGGEQYILSAVMHADERNKALSDELGKDIYHYHLHVVYVPVVRKEVYFRKNNKNPELAGKLREVITQVSHSKKWPIKMPVEKNGKTVFLNTYSLLQDRFFEHMRAAGYDGFERGERGSTAEHLSDLEYKTKQEHERSSALAAAADETQKSLETLGERVERKEKLLEKLDNMITVKRSAAATIVEIDIMGKPGLLGGFNVTADDMNKLKALAKKSVKTDERIANMKYMLKSAENERDDAKARLAAERNTRPSVAEQLDWHSKFMAASRRAPKRLKVVIEDILQNPQEMGIVQEQERKTGRSPDAQ